MNIEKVNYYGIVRFNYNINIKDYEGKLFEFSPNVNNIYDIYFKKYVYHNVINEKETNFSLNNNHPKLYYIVGFRLEPNYNLNYNVIFRKFPKFCIYVDLQNNTHVPYLGSKLSNYIYQDLNKIELFANLNNLQSQLDDYKINVNHITSLSMDEYLNERKIKYQQFCFTYYETKEDVIYRILLQQIKYTY
jgi:hypothetical protein